MIKLLSWIFFSLSFQCFAEEEAVEVGKYANPNLDAVSMIMSLLMVLVLIIISAWVLRKFNVVNQSVAGMKVITSLPLGHKEKLIVVQVGEEQLLLAVSAQQITYIKTLEKPLEVGDAISPAFGQSFKDIFVKKSHTSSKIKSSQ